MSKPDRSRVIRVTEAQARIPGPAGEHAVAVFRRGPLDIALSLPQRPSQQTPHAQDEIYFIVRGRGCSRTTASVTLSSQATSCSWLRESSTKSRRFPRILRCGAYFTGLPAGRFHYRESQSGKPPWVVPDFAKPVISNSVGSVKSFLKHPTIALRKSGLRCSLCLPSHDDQGSLVIFRSASGDSNPR
jgi:hypothetical protein